jgi:hypothetical protein
MQTCFRSCAGPRASTWLLTCPTTPTFYLFSTHFLTTLNTCFGLSHPIVIYFLRHQCGHTIDDLSTHLFQCLCENEHITTHNTLWNTIVIVVLENGAHVQWKVSHLFPCHTQQRMDILITKDNFWTLMDIVITNTTHTYIVQWMSTTTHATIMVVQKKTQSYVEWTSCDDFIPLSMWHMDVFILVLIHFLSHVHKPLLHFINDL